MVASDDYDVLLKVVMVGDSGVGKSCLLKRFASKEWQDGYISTIGVDFEIVTLKLNNQVVKLQIWDTAGQERFHNITTSYYRGAHAIMLVYDITSSQSFQNVSAKWLEQIRMYANRDCVVLVVGNKSDLTDQRAVTNESAQELADHFNLDVMDASAKDGVNVDRAFHWLAEKGLEVRMTQDNRKQRAAVSLHQKQEETSCC